jgi:hypothetical protein
MNRWMLTPLLLAAALTVVSCTENTQVAGGGSGGTGTGPAGATVGGTVSGFGSIIVNGTRYDDAQATVQIDVQPGTPTPATRGDIRLGMQVDIQANDTQVASRIQAAAEAIGSITSVAANGRSLVLAGQAVRIDADPLVPTVLDGFSGNTLVNAAGMPAEVYGQRNAAGEIVATRIARAAAGSTVTRVSGSIATLDAAQQRFTLNGLTVNYGQSTLIPAASMLAVGRRVTVWTDLALAGTAPSMTARIVRVDQPEIPDGASASLGGVITGFAAPAQFQLLGVAVDAAQATYVAGTAANLRNGAVVTVAGRYTANVLRATEVRFTVPADVATEITGPVGNFVDVNSVFSVRNAQVRLAPGVQYVGGTAANLGNDAVIKVRGTLAMGVLQVTRVEFIAPPPAATAALAGVVSNYMSAPGTFALAPWPYEFALQPGTVFRGGNRSDLRNGKEIVARGVLSANLTRFVVNEVEFTDTGGATVVLTGFAEDVDATRFEVNGVDITTDGSTQYVGPTNTRADLVNGVEVEVTARRVNGSYKALRVEVLPPANSRVRGTVTQFVSLADFRVAGTRVDASRNPRVVPGNRSLNDIANGVELEVRGEITGGTLRASRVRFR